MTAWCGRRAMTLDHRHDRVRGLGHRTFPVACCSRTVDGLAHARREQRPRYPTTPTSLPSALSHILGATTRPSWVVLAPRSSPLRGGRGIRERLPRRCSPAPKIRAKRTTALKDALLTAAGRVGRPLAVSPAHRSARDGHRVLACGQVGDLRPEGCEDGSP